jgi:uncharacterized protein YjbJ (UPF0337 family)
MNEDRIAGTARNVGGKVQEGFGRVTGDAKSQADGLINQAAGAAQDFYGQAKETASDAAQVVRQGAIDTEDYVRRHYRRNEASGSTGPVSPTDHMGQRKGLVGELPTIPATASGSYHERC